MLRREVPARDALARRWQARHPGFAVDGGLLGRWLRLMWGLARPLAAARIPPDAVTAAGLACSLAAVRARPGRGAGWLVAGAVADGLDGAVAVLADHTSAHGPALDHAADRAADLAAAVVLVRAGAPWPVVAPGLALTIALELTRRTPVVTVAERPTRVVCGALGDLAAARTGRRWPAVVSALVWDVLAAVALAQHRRVPKS